MIAHVSLNKNNLLAEATVNSRKKMTTDTALVTSTDSSLGRDSFVNARYFL